MLLLAPIVTVNGKSQLGMAWNALAHKIYRTHKISIEIVDQHSIEIVDQHSID
jgi:hypothetical protein